MDTLDWAICAAGKEEHRYRSCGLPRCPCVALCWCFKRVISSSGVCSLCTAVNWTVLFQQHQLSNAHSICYQVDGDQGKWAHVGIVQVQSIPSIWQHACCAPLPSSCTERKVLVDDELATIISLHHPRGAPCYNSLALALLLTGSAVVLHHSWH